MFNLFKAFAILVVGAVTFASFGATVSADELSDWRRDVAKVVVKKQKYPRSAISRNIEGSAKIKVTIARDGSLAGYEISEATGESILDRQLDKIMTSVDALPTPPAAAGDADLTFIIPIVWRLS